MATTHVGGLIAELSLPSHAGSRHGEAFILPRACARAAI